MLLRVLPIIISVLGMLTTPAWAETLPVPPSLVDADSDAGEHLFLESEARQAYFPLAANFLTQKYQSYCGVASIVMVLNALQLPAPAVPEFAPYRTFTQDNVLDERTDAVLPRDILLKKGMTLDQLGSLLALQPLNVDVRSRPARKMKVGAQKCVIQRVRNSAGSVTSRGFQSLPPKKSRVWSKAIRAMTKPRRRSMLSKRGRTLVSLSRADLLACATVCVSAMHVTPSFSPKRHPA